MKERSEDLTAATATAAAALACTAPSLRGTYSTLLRAYADGELAPSDMARVATHLGECAYCADLLAGLRTRAAGVSAGLDLLEGRAAPPDPRRALDRFRTVLAHQDSRLSRPGVPGHLSRSFEMIRRNVFGPRWRPLTVAITAVLVIAILFTIAPVRDAAADFLALFRIRKFAVIPLDDQQVQRLSDLAQQAESAFGEPQVVRAEGPEQAVNDSQQAAALAGFAVKVPTNLPEGAQLDQFYVQAGPAIHYEVDRAVLAAMLQAAGADTAALPQTDKLVFDVDVAAGVWQRYKAGMGGLEVVQVPSPQVNLPEGIDPAALAEAGFLFLGMPPEDAKRMATTIDWTSTLVVPLPATAAKAREVTVDGVTGLFLEESDRSNRNGAVLWEREGILYLVSGKWLDERSLLAAADSLQ